MSAESNREFIQRYAAALSRNRKTPELVAQYVEDVALQEHIALFEAAFPGYEFIVDDVIAEGDKVALRATFKGTHKAEFQGIAPTGRGVTLPVQIIYRLANGRITEHWLSVDSLSLLQHLGAVPEPAAASSA